MNLTPVQAALQRRHYYVALRGLATGRRRCQHREGGPNSNACGLGPRHPIHLGRRST